MKISPRSFKASGIVTTWRHLRYSFARTLHLFSALGHCVRGVKQIVSLRVNPFTRRYSDSTMKSQAIDAIAFPDGATVVPSAAGAVSSLKQHIQQVRIQWI